MSFTSTASFIWSVANLLRGNYRQSDYGKVILPFTLLRRLECVLEPTHAQLITLTSQATVGGVYLGDTVEVEDCSTVETTLHIAFVPNRINPKREFFEIEPEQAIAVLKVLGKKDVTPMINRDLNINVTDAERASTVKSNRRLPLDYEVMGIPVGATLTYIDDETITVEIASSKKVKYNNEVVSLTKATQEILKLDYAVQPTRHWLYEGKSLQEVYDETYTLEDI